MINRDKIEGTIFKYVKDALHQGSPSYIDADIRDAIKVFYDFSICKLGYAEIDGFSKIILKPLQSLSANSADLDALRTLSTSLEPFFKRLIVMLGLDKYSKIKGMTLYPLLKAVKVNTYLSTQIPPESYSVLDKANLLSYKGKPEYLEYICLSYMTRNEVHNACNWGVKETIARIEATLVLYIYTILAYKETLQTKVNAMLSDIDGSVLDTQENKWLYDFMTYGKSANELKTRIVDAFILNFIFDNGLIQKEVLGTEVRKQFGSGITDGFLGRRINKLRSDKRITFYEEQKSFDLTEYEKNRINQVRENFRDNKSLFFMYLEDILIHYDIQQYKNELIENLKKLYSDNFNLDLSEIYENGNDGTNEQYQIISNFIDNHLMAKVSDRDSADLLMRDLLKLCVESDFLICISASSVFNNITNTEKYQNFINQPTKNIYLDTQIVLYSLCLDFRIHEQFDNTMYRITKELCIESQKYKDIDLIFSSHYIAEISFQLKNALGLIAFERLFDRYNGKLSTNIFYQFYSALRINNATEDDFSFGDFMEECFSLYEEDLYDSSFFSVSETIVRDKIKELGYIKVVDIPQCSNIQEIEKLMELVINDMKLPPKTYHILKNDAIMLSHLSNENEHLNAPFFLTWDKSFVDFRKKYNDKFLRRSAHNWHIFSPSKFINHVALMNMHIDPQSISDDFLSVIDSFGLAQRTRTIYDNHNRFLDIKNISKEKRYRYIGILKELFGEVEFSYDTDDNTLQIVNANYEGIIDALNRHYYEDRTLNIEQYRLMLLQEDYFIKVTNLLKDQLLDSKEDQIATRDYEPFLSKVDLLVKEFIGKQKIQSDQ